MECFNRGDYPMNYKLKEKIHKTRGKAMEKINKFVPGSYSAEAEGMHKVKVDVTVDKSKIIDLNLHLEGESKNFGQAATEELRKQILNAQSVDIDGVSGASLTTNAVKEAIGQALENATGKGHKINLSLSNGTFFGKAIGHGGPLTVKLITQNNKIKDVKVVEQKESPAVADFVMREIPKQIVKQQTLAIDAISGASVTSKAVLQATGNALEAAGGDVISWKMQPYKKPRNYKPQDLKTDVVIMGAGISGLSTALFAIKHGLKVILIEKNGQVGGSFRYSAGGYALANTKKLAAKGFDDSLDNIKKFVHRLNDGTTSNLYDPNAVIYLMERSGETFDQLAEATNSEVAGLDMFTSEPYLHGTFGGSAGAHEADLMEKYIKENGGSILLNTSVTDILVENKKVVGLKANYQGITFEVKAKNVVIASGGTSYNHMELLENETPGISKEDVYNEANVGNTGDGYDLLVKLGAKKDGEDVYKNGFFDFAPELFITWRNVPDFSKAILIDEDGRRFTNEAPFEPAMVTALQMKRGSSAYYLIYSEDDIDSDLKERLSWVRTGRKVYEVADIPEKLAVKLGISPQIFAQTIANYNDNCRKKRDPLGKKAKDLKLLQGRLYAVYVMPGVWGTMGGVRTNRKMQVRKTDGTFFDNLFAIGETATGDLFTEYYMGGFSLAYYSTEGRLVAEYLATEK